MIEHGVLFAAGYKGEPSQIGEHGSRPILSIKPQQGARLGKAVRGEVLIDGCEALAQFRSVALVPPVAKRAEPLETVSLADDRARSHHLPTLAPPVARGTDLIQPAKSRGQLFSLRQGTPSGRLTCAVNVKDDPSVSRSIH